MFRRLLYPKPPDACPANVICPSGEQKHSSVQKMITKRKVPIVLLMLWFGASGVPALINGPSDDYAKASGMKNEIANMKTGLQAVESKAGKQPEIRATLMRVESAVDSVIQQESRRYKWRRWAAGLNLMIVLFFLVYCLKDKYFLTKQPADGKTPESPLSHSTNSNRSRVCYRSKRSAENMKLLPVLFSAMLFITGCSDNEILSRV